MEDSPWAADWVAAAHMPDSGCPSSVSSAAADAIRGGAVDLAAVGRGVGGHSLAGTRGVHDPCGEAVIQAAAVRRPVLDREGTNPAQDLPVLRASAGAQSRASMICSRAPA